MTIQRRSFLAALLVPAAITAGLVACGGGDGTETVATPPAAPPDPTADPEPTVPQATNPVCDTVEGEYQATKERSNVLFLMDRSGSMKIRLSNGDTRWSATKRGLFDLLASLPSTTQAGAMMFPQGDAPVTFCSISSQNEVYCTPGPTRPPKYPRCDAATYHLGVTNAELTPQQITSIEGYVSTADSEFYYGTPLAFALKGAIDAQRASALPGAKSVILLTDGNPADCENSQDPTADDIQRVIDAAAIGASGTPLVRTFVMGVVDGDKGATPSNLSPIAKAGGTARSATCDRDNSCFYAINAATFQQDIKKAFEQVSLQAFDCTFNAPQGNANSDPSKVNVELTTSSGRETVQRDPNHQDGWDYLPNGTQIQLYGQACTDMKDDPNAKVSIVIGCKTVTAPTPR